MSESGFHVSTPSVTVYFFTDDTFNQTGSNPTGFGYTTVDGSNKITIFDIPPPTPTSTLLYYIDTFASADWTPPRGKKIGGWKYWSGTDFQMASTEPLSENNSIYQPGEKYEYNNSSVLIPNWIDEEYYIYFFTDDKFYLDRSSNPVGIVYYTPSNSSIYGQITMFEFPPRPVTRRIIRYRLR